MKLTPVSGGEICIQSVSATDNTVKEVTVTCDNNTVVLTPSQFKLIASMWPRCTTGLKDGKEFITFDASK